MNTPTTEQERELLVQGLMSLQTGCDEQFARQILKKHGWNADQAATALLDVATEGEKTNDARSLSHVKPYRGALNASQNAMSVLQRPTSAVIDLTGDDDEDTAKALVASMETQPVFGPSNRVDDAQQWAVVPSNAPPVLSQEDKALNRALAASLRTTFVGVHDRLYEEASDPLERVRKEGWPSALRTTNFTLCYAPIVLQCLLSLPNLRARLLRYSVNFDGSEGQHSFAQGLQRLAAILTHTARAYVPVDDILESLVPLSSNNQDTLTSATIQYFNTMSSHLEQIPRPRDDPFVEKPLLSFQGIGTDADANESSNYSSATYIELAVPSASGNDLVSCLTDSFTKNVPSPTGMEKVPFKYPPRLYLDRFMRDNLERANELRNCQEGNRHEAQKLETDRLKLSSWKNADTLTDLRSSVRYFETVAADGGDATRKEAHERSRLKLLEIIKQIEANMHHLDTRLQELTVDAQGMFDNVELQKHGYDLRAAIIHDGLFGRKHQYLYTKDDKGRWWKIVDREVSEVTEHLVLNDSTGFHMGAGPLLLFYSQTSPNDPALQNAPEPLWPRFVRDLVRQDNDMFVTQLPTEVAAVVMNRSDAEAILFNDIGLDDSVAPGLSMVNSADTQKSSLETETG